MIKASKRAGMGRRLGMRWYESVLRCCEAMDTRVPGKTAGASMKTARVIEVLSRTIVVVVAIYKRSAVRHINVVVENDSSVVPVKSPVVPSPAEPTKEADSEAYAERNPWTAKVESRVWIPTWPHS
jgi:hypothetical protein